MFVGEEFPLSRLSSSNREAEFDSGPIVSNAETPAGVLQEIGMKCGTKVALKRHLFLAEVIEVCYNFYHSSH